MSDKAEEEVWKQYPDYDFIEVSSLGRVRTKNRIVIGKDGKKYHFKGRVFKQRLSKDGYMHVCISMNGKKIDLKVHRMVAITFLPNPNNLPEVNHIDNDRTNNAISNLEWCDRQYNQDYKKKFGTSPAQIQGRPVIAINPETGEVLWFESQSEAARLLSINRGNMNSVIKGKHHHETVGGFWFCYADENAVEKTREKFGDKVAHKVEELINKN